MALFEVGLRTGVSPLTTSGPERQLYCASWDYGTAVVEYISSRFVLGAVTPVVNALSPEHSDESLGDSIIAGMPNHTHAAYRAVAAEISLVVTTGESAASIRV